ncbi:MAG TPA: hypothetical protein VM689_19410 [Aliidongia sp.]|nr:hypothetical protein [Aliidongia sp.]
MRRTLVPAVLSLLLLASCAMPTPFKAADPDGSNGYSVQQLEANRYMIGFAGNASTPRPTVESYLLYLASQIAVKDGYDYFVLNEKSLDKSVNYETFDTGFGGGFFGRRRGFGGGFDTAYTTPYNSYSVLAEVLLYKGPKPANDPKAYDAHAVSNSLTPQVVRSVPPIGPY